MTTTDGARHQRLEHSAAYEKMKRLRALVGRDRLYQPTLMHDGEWHLVCLNPQCRQAFMQLTKNGPGYTFSISELLSTAVAHEVQCHAIELTYEHYGEDYA